MDPPVMGRVPRRRSGQRERGELSKIAKNRRRWAASSAAFLGCQATDPRRRGLPRCGVPRRCATPVRARYATDRGAFRTVGDRSAAIDPQRNNALRPRRVLDEKDQPNRNDDEEPRTRAKAAFRSEMAMAHCPDEFAAGATGSNCERSDARFLRTTDRGRDAG